MSRAVAKGLGHTGLMVFARQQPRAFHNAICNVGDADLSGDLQSAGPEVPRQEGRLARKQQSVKADGLVAVPSLKTTLVHVTRGCGAGFTGQPQAVSNPLLPRS